MLGKKLGIDLGSSATRLMAREGLIFAEPTVLAVRQGDLTLSLFGSAALEAAGEDPGLQLLHPVVSGEVADAPGLRALVQHVVNRAVGRQRIFKPDVVIAVRAGLGGGDRRVVLDAASRAGARTAYLIDAPIAAAIGTGASLASAAAHLVIDFGAGKTDIAAIALEGTVASRSLGLGEEDLLARLDMYLQARHQSRLTRPELSQLLTLMVAAPHEERTAEVGGLTLSSNQLDPLLAAHLEPIDLALRDVLAELPRPLENDIHRNGILLTGGGARREGLARHVSRVTGCSARVAVDPESCAVRGAAMAVDTLDVLKRNFMYIR